MLGKTFLRTATTVLAVGALTMFWQPVPAQAQWLPSPDAGATPVATASVVPSDSGLSSAFGNSLTTGLQNLLCPIVTGVASTTTNVPGVGPLVDLLPEIVCSINIAGYVYKTTYVPPSGPPIVRYTPALAGVPTALNVDGAGLPDFVGTLSISLGLNGVSLNINRSGFAPTGKVSIEAIAIDPASANTFVGFGEDGTATGTARGWTGTLSVLGFSASTVDLGVDVKATAPQSSLAVIGELFSGSNPDNPDHIYRGNASFSPVPAAFSPRIRLSQGRQEVIVNSPPTTLTAKVNVISPGRQQNIDLTADQLPSTIDIVHNAGSSDTTTYDATGPIAKLTGAYHDIVSGNIATAAALDVWGVPQHLIFDQTADTTSLSAGTGKIDRVQARFAQGSDVDALDTATTPFARYHRTTSSAFKAAVQVSDLKSLSIQQSSPYGGELVFANAPGLFPITAQDDVTSTHVTGSLSGLPADTTVSLDPDNGKVTFDGHGTGIAQIKLSATRPVPFFQRATRLDATLDNLPALETVNVKQSAGGVTATASAPLGTISLLASDGHDAPSIAGSAADYEDTPSLYRAFVRLSGLEGVSFQTDPIVGSMQTSASQVLTVHGDTNGIKFDGVINKLPSNMTFSMAPGSGGSNVVDFNSHGESIDQITASGDGLPAPAGMPKFEAEIDHLPSHLTLTLPASNGTVVFDSHSQRIGRVYAQAYGGSKVAVDPNRQLLTYSEGQYVAANLLQVGSAQVSESAKPLHLQYDIAAIPLDYAVTTPDVQLHGTIANPQPATININPLDKNVDGSGGVKATYHVDPASVTGDGSIDSISLIGTISGAYLEANLAHIPANLDICLQTDRSDVCKPNWTPIGVGDHTVEPPDFAMHFFPTDLTGHVPSTPLVVNGIACPDTADASTCKDLGQNKKRIVIDNLAFKTVEAAFSSTDEHCDVACGAVWAEASTFGPGSPIEGDHITGRVRYFDGDGDIFPDPKIDLNLPDPGGFLALNKLFFYLHYDVVSFTPIEYGTSGTLTCGNSPTGHLIIGINNFPDPDLLDGTFGVC